MQIRCTTCTKTIAIAATGALPPTCPHCSQNAVPAQLGPYVPQRLVATGGMGEIYLARHHELGTEVALKLLPAMPLDVVDDVRKRFAREARLTAEVSHPGVVRVLASDIAGDRPYLVLEFVDGTTLRQKLEAGPLPAIEAARIAADTADVLAAAHEKGVLHRDIKPDNVMVDAADRVRVLDFGIARAVQDDAPLTRTGEIVGTPEYMAPEQLLDGPEATDVRTDVHALGVLLYELLTGRSPFRGANVFQALKLVESLEPKPPSELVESIPRALDAVVGQALQKRQQDRQPSASVFAEQVRAAVPAAAQSTPPPDAPTRSALRELATTFLLAVVTSLGTLGVIWWLYEQPTAPQQTAGSAQAIAPAPTAVEQRLRMRSASDEGKWSQALDDADQAWTAGDREARSIARRAFVLGHTVWFHAAGLPSWLSACDLGQRQRLLGDLLEPQGPGDVLQRLLGGATDAWAELQAEPSVAGPAAIQLIAVRELPMAERADALATYAQRLPIEQPEHWLARTIERHLRGDRPGAVQAAEMAWLSGAGEVAVLLDAGLASLPEAGCRELQRSRAAATRIWQRLAAADLTDNPASILLQLTLECRSSVTTRFDPSSARTFPAPHRQAARDWLVAAAGSAAAEPAAAEQRVRLLRVAAVLGASPDFDAEPWRSVTDGDARRQLEQEAQGGR